MLIIAAALVAASATPPLCDWKDPGRNVFMGDVVAAADYYQEIPLSVRAKLKKRMDRREYDDVAVITRDRIEGKYRYVDMRDMHYGEGKVCPGLVVRPSWSASHRERGLVYCEDDHCLIVPTVCRNVSAIVRKERLGGGSESGRPRALQAPGGHATNTAVVDVPLPSGSGSLAEVAFFPPVEERMIPADEPPLMWGLELPPLPVLWGYGSRVGWTFAGAATSVVGPDPAPPFAGSPGTPPTPVPGVSPPSLVPNAGLPPTGDPGNPSGAPLPGGGGNFADPIPEPEVLWLLLIGLLSIWLQVRRRK